KHPKQLGQSTRPKSAPQCRRVYRQPQCRRRHKRYPFPQRVRPQSLHSAKARQVEKPQSKYLTLGGPTCAPERRQQAPRHPRPIWPQVSERYPKVGLAQRQASHRLTRQGSANIAAWPHSSLPTSRTTVVVVVRSLPRIPRYTMKIAAATIAISATLPTKIP